MDNQYEATIEVELRCTLDYRTTLLFTTCHSSDYVIIDIATLHGFDTIKLYKKEFLRAMGKLFEVEL